jgi:hypothetical protein
LFILRFAWRYHHYRRDPWNRVKPIDHHGVELDAQRWQQYSNTLKFKFMYNFANLLSATMTELTFDFSPTSCCIQQNVQFTSSSNGAQLVTIFAELEPSFPGDPQGSLGGMGIAPGPAGHLSVKYLSGPQVIGVAAVPVPGPLVGAGLPGLVMALGGLIAWRHRRMAAV